MSLTEAISTEFNLEFIVALAIGSGKLLPNGELRPLEVKIGDKILFVRGTGHKVEMDNQQYTFMKEEDILGILR